MDRPTFSTPLICEKSAFADRMGCLRASKVATSAEGVVESDGASLDNTDAKREKILKDREAFQVQDQCTNYSYLPRPNWDMLRWD